MVISGLKLVHQSFQLLLQNVIFTHNTQPIHLMLFQPGIIQLLLEYEAQATSNPYAVIHIPLCAGLTVRWTVVILNQQLPQCSVLDSNAG